MNETSKILIISLISLIAIVNSHSVNFGVGDTINLLDKNNSKHVISDIFNGFDGSNYIKTGISHKGEYEVSCDRCLLFESLKEFFYPKVYIGEELTTSASVSLFDDMEILKDENFGIHQDYINDKRYRYGIVRVCKTIEKKSLNIELINENDFPKVEEENYYSILNNQTAIFRLKHSNETHYVSSISTGTCLVQIYIKDAIRCVNYDKLSASSINNNFFSNSIYKSPIRTLDNNRNLEDKINDYYFRNDIYYSLFSFRGKNFPHRQHLLDMLENNFIIRMKLTSLPELLISASQNFDLSPTNLIKSEDINPGDVFKLDDLLYDNFGPVAVKNILMHEVYETIIEEIPEFYTYNYSNCRDYKFNKNSTLLGEKFNVFEETLKDTHDKSYSLYLNGNYTCLELTICSKLKTETLDLLPMTIIKLNEESITKLENNVFENNNIMLWFSRTSETHFATRTEKGHCFFQMLVYSFITDYYRSGSIFDSTPVYKGRILSASKDHDLENEISNLVNYDFRNIIGTRRNITTVFKVFEVLDRQEKNALINLYLSKLY